MWESLNTFLPGFIVGVSANFATLMIIRLAKSVYPVLRVRLREAGAWCRRAGERISSWFREVSVLDAAKRYAVGFAKLASQGVCLLAYIGWWGLVIYTFASKFTGSNDVVRASEAGVTISGACYCPAPVHEVYSEPVLRSEQPQYSVLDNGTLRHCSRPNYSPTYASPTTDGTELLGNPLLERKGGKNRRGGRLGSAGNAPVPIGPQYRVYSVGDEPQ